MFSAENEPPKAVGRKPPRNVARMATQLGLLGALLGVTLLGVQVYRQLDNIRAAPQNDVRWSVTQLEVDVIALDAALDGARAAIALAEGDIDNVAGELAHVRTRFDILWSRVDILATGSAFTELRRVEAVHETLSALRRFLRDGVDAVDSSDTALAERIAWLATEMEAASDGVRLAAVEGVRAFAEISDRQRLEFTRLLQTTALAVLGLIVALAGTLIVLRRASRLSAARGRETAQSRQRFAAAINASLDAIVVIDARGRILVWNHAAEQVFGYSRSAAIGAEMAELIVPPSLRMFHRRGMQRYLETGERRMIGSGRQETRGLRADGVETPIEVSIAAAQGEDGPIFTAYIRDISDRIEADRALMRARDEAMAADRAKTEFIGVMSHEMRTPLNGVLGTMDLLRATALDPMQVRYVNTALASGEILLRHVNDVLDIVRIEADRFAPEPAPFLPQAMLDRLALVTRPLIEAGGNRLWIDADLPDGALVGDTRRIEQVLLNLLGNAAKFTADGVITLEAKTISCTEDAAVLELAVRDTGPGVAEADQQRIFQDFVTLDASYERTSSGTGLGLGICRRIVGALGGDIGLESDIGEGARFWVRLVMPRAPAEMAAEHRRDTPAAGALSAPAKVRETSMTPLRVLVVEDNETNRFVAHEMLTGQGHAVDMAANGQLGVEAADACAYDLILMDISMPGMDGVTATEAIRAGDGPSARATILGLTAHALPEEQTRFRDVGMDGCLTKPLRLATLIETLEQVAPAILTTAAQHAPAPDHDEDDDDDDDVMDANVLAELSMTFSRAHLASLLLRAAREIEQMQGEIDALGATGPLADLGAAVHKLAGTVGLVGGRRLHGALFAAESACKDDDRDAALRAIATMPPLVDETIAALKEIAAEAQSAVPATSSA